RAERGDRLNIDAEVAAVFLPSRDLRKFLEAVMDEVEMTDVDHVLLGFLNMRADGAANTAARVLAGCELFELRDFEIGRRAFGVMVDENDPVHFANRPAGNFRA